MVRSLSDLILMTLLLIVKLFFMGVRPSRDTFFFPYIDKTHVTTLKTAKYFLIHVTLHLPCIK